MDRCADLCREGTRASCLINFGGDIAVSRPPETQPWRVGIEAAAGQAHQPTIALKGGGVATSGDSRRFLLKDGVRYSHILDPLTGWPVANAPRAVTVVAPSCTQAGMLATPGLAAGRQRRGIPRRPGGSILDSAVAPERHLEAAHSRPGAGPLRTTR